jgi:hypothetical protein
MMAPISEHSAIASPVIRPFRETQPVNKVEDQLLSTLRAFLYAAVHPRLRVQSKHLARVRRLVLHSFICFLRGEELLAVGEYIANGTAFTKGCGFAARLGAEADVDR